MSHTVTITRTTTTSGTTSALIINTGYLKTIPGLLKLVQLLLGAVCTGITFWYLNSDYVSISSPEFFFLLMVVTFMIATFCLLISCLFSLSTGGIISKTIYELIYHTIACILILAASLNFIIRIDRYKGSRRYEPYMVASILGLVNAILYCISAIFAQRSYKGI
ncbi:uncharacterized protein LOC119656890 isoform X2 [Hermetia illucens]|uniref:uncharacterized protein LOC119656890 isoform X2 n=1 Tax=Hermetia illucens TaxID=343691 RepID=UPI0018CC7B7E|nr:uncharacterized protein LOC119656890 isoform X2 [Hermetia illucens]